MAIITIDLSGKNGLVHNYYNDKDESSSTPNRRFLAAEGQMAEGTYNPFTRYGYMSPSNTGLGTVTSSSAYDDEIAAVQYDEDNEDFYLAGGTKIFRGTNADDVDVTLQKTLTSSTVTDLEIYQVNGVKKIFYSYKKTAASDIGIASLPFASSDDTWLSATVGGDQFNLSDTLNHKMVPADNGFMYVLDSSSLHKIDGSTGGGTNGTATANVLVFPAYINLYDAVDSGGKLYIVTQDTTTPVNSIVLDNSYTINTGIYVWDRQSTTVSFVNFIPVTGVQAIHKIYISPEGNIRIMVTSGDGRFQIRALTGNAFRVIQEAGQEAAPRKRDGVHVGNLVVTWFGSDGLMYSHGRVSHQDKEGLFKIGNIQGGVANLTTGAILYAGGDSLGSSSGRYESYYISYDDSSAISVKKWLPHALVSASGIGFTQTTDQGDVFTPVSPLPVLSDIKSVRIYCLPTDNTGTTKVADIKFYFNQSATSSFTKSITRTDASKGYVEFEINKSFVTTVQFEIEFNTSQSAGGNDFAPYLATIEYDPSDAVKSNPS